MLFWTLSKCITLTSRSWTLISSAESTARNKNNIYKQLHSYKSLVAYCSNIPDCAVSILDKLVDDLGGEVVGEKPMVEAVGEKVMVEVDGEHGGSTNAAFLT